MAYAMGLDCSDHTYCSFVPRLFGVNPRWPGNEAMITLYNKTTPAQIAAITGGPKDDWGRQPGYLNMMVAKALRLVHDGS